MTWRENHDPGVRITYPESESSELCEIVPQGTDTNGDEWSQCTVHGFLVLGDAYLCEGYRAPAYVERGHCFSSVEGG